MQPSLLTRVLLAPALGLGALFLAGCPSNPSRENFDYLRQANNFRVDTLPADHPFCAGQTPFASVDECKQARKYRLSWESPEDTSGFVEYRVYVDTTPPDAPGKTWKEVRANRALAGLALGGAGGKNGDSIIFAIHPPAVAATPLELKRGEARIVGLDTASRIDTKGRLVLAMVTAYGESGLNGQPQYTFLVASDVFPPHPIDPVFTPLERSVEIAWNRPLDATSFFDPGADSGLIREFVLHVTRGGVLRGNRPGTFAPTVRFVDGGEDRTARVTADSSTFSGAPVWLFHLPDSQHVANRDAPDPRDSLKVTVQGLSPEDTVDFRVWAVDSSGNTTDTLRFTRVILTDTTEPSAPSLRLEPGTVTRNQFAYAFGASRDSVPGGGGLSPGPTPNFNIREYRISRKLLAGSISGYGGKDSIIAVTGDNIQDSVFHDTVRYLPPGAAYRIYVQAVDSSGHRSRRDSLDVSTDSVRFAGPDSGAQCPPGLIPMPAARFTLGDTAASADADEKPAKARMLGSYCIEPQEHRDSTSFFQTRFTWEQAERACADMSPTDGTHLCTEAEWERACETGDSIPLTYGMQAEKSGSKGLFETCNIATGDTDMAFKPELRNPACLTSEGAFDLPGNLAEWVRDAYAQNAYTQSSGDTLVPGNPLTPPQDSGLHGIRGYSYLKKDSLAFPTPVLLHESRCSNRDYPKQVRPRALPGCVDADYPLIVLTYNRPANPIRCLPLPDSLRGKPISSVSPTRDSTQITFLVDGVAQPVTYVLPFDTAFAKYRPVDSKLSPKALAAVTFVNSATGASIPDTLDAVEMLHDSSQTALATIFSREAAPPWSVRKAGGAFEVRYLFAYSPKLVTVPARAQYSNPAIGFRCCSKIRP